MKLVVELTSRFVYELRYCPAEGEPVPETFKSWEDWAKWHIEENLCVQNVIDKLSSDVAKDEAARNCSQCPTSYVKVIGQVPDDEGDLFKILALVKSPEFVNCTIERGMVFSQYLNTMPDYAAAELIEDEMQ